MQISELLVRSPTLPQILTEWPKREENLRIFMLHKLQPVSRAGLLTGCYNVRIGILGALGPKSNIGISPNEVTIAEICKQKGYATGCLENGIWDIIRNFFPNSMDSMNILVCPIQTICGLTIQGSSFTHGRKA